MHIILLLVYLCVGKDCGCERVALGFTEKRFLIMTKRTQPLNLELEFRTNIGGLAAMKQDTSYYFVYSLRNKEGIFMTISHVRGGLETIGDNPVPMDTIITLRNRRECFQSEQDSTLYFFKNFDGNRN